MKKSLPLVVFAALLTTHSAVAQDWSLGAATGPFVFGDLARRTMRTGTPEGGASAVQHATLSAATRPGIVVDVQRSFAPRWAFRVSATYSRAPLAFKDRDDDRGVSVGAGDLDIASLALPLLFRINPNGTFRFHILGGPAHAVYHFTGRRNANSEAPLFTGSRTRWGATAGVGMAWHWSRRVALEVEANDMVTASPFNKSDISSIGRVEIPRPNHIHTTVGLRWSF